MLKKLRSINSFLMLFGYDQNLKNHPAYKDEKIHSEDSI